jgi:prepilin-type N-terminal cleavage/methylation domain-containing protein
MLCHQENLAMNRNHTGSRKGFSLVELLAVVMILAVLAAIAIPMYINSRKTAAARACISNIAAIAAAESAWATRNGSYNYDATSFPVTQNVYIAGTATVPPHGGLVGAPEGLSDNLPCPLALLGSVNSYGVVDGGTGNCVITCRNASEHANVLGTVATYSMTLAAPGSEGVAP